jgi:hypothetical protein
VALELDERFIIAVEQKLGAALPYSYRRAMMTNNGGRVLAFDDVWDLHPILNTSDRRRLKRSCNDILRETKFMSDWPSWPEGAIAIASNGGADRLVLLKVNRWFEPTIYVWLHDTGELVAVANVFSDLATGKTSDGPRTPPGYVLVHGRGGRSRMRVTWEVLYKLEESIRHRRRASGAIPPENALGPGPAR